MRKIILAVALVVLAAAVSAETVVDVEITDPSDGDQTCDASACVYGKSTAVGGSGDLDVVFVMDTSGSMATNDPSGFRKTGAKALIDLLPEGSQVAIAVVDFDSNAFVSLGFTDNHGDAKDAIDALGASGGTNIGVAVDTANDYLIANGRTGAAWVEILFTDGQGAYSSQYTTDAANAGIVIHTMGLSSNVDEDLLKDIADETGGTYTFVDDPANLPNVFPALTLTNIVEVKVNGNKADLSPNGDFKYCSVDLNQGPNVIEAVAESTDGTFGSDEVIVTGLGPDSCGEILPGGDVPEFTLIGAALALLGTGTVVFLKRRT